MVTWHSLIPWLAVALVLVILKIVVDLSELVSDGTEEKHGRF